MNKKERKQAQLERHYQALTKLAALCGVDNVNGKKLSNKLRKIEAEISRHILDYSNGDRNNINTELDLTKNQVQSLFNNKLQGFFINTDPRGYALKIKSNYQDILRNSGINLQSDWGGYGLLAPEITGD